MKRLLSAILVIGSLLPAGAQTQTPVIPSRFGLYMARVILKDGTMHAGWLVGTIRDSVVLQVGLRSERHPMANLLRVTVETKPNKSAAGIIGFMAGMYLGDLLAMRSEHQSAPFIEEYESPLAYAGYSVLFGLIGGGIGYLGMGAGTREEIFDFNGTPEQNAAAWSFLVEGSEADTAPKKIRISFYAGSVSSPMTAGGDSFYPGGGCSSWNMLRRVQVTYAVADRADIGVARMTLGQPRQAIYGYYLYGSVTTLRFDGYGYFLAGAIEPFHGMTGRVFSWTVGGGVGRASYEFESQRMAYSSYGTDPVVFRVIDRKDAFAGFVCTELAVRLDRGFSLAVWADRVLTNAGPPDLGDLQINGSTYGSSAFGVSIAFHL
jgi:hypothetical protein